MATLPRGLRNNNPCNIRRSANKWRGLAAVQADSEFCTFVSLDVGLRAAFVILRTYIRKYRLTSVSSVIRRWAPASENNTLAYIEAVIKKSGIPANERLDFSRKNQMCRLVWAMCFVECGCEVSFGRIENAYQLV